MIIFILDQASMSNSIHLYFADILDSKRLELLPSLYTFTQQGYLLWWGTALALVYGHRESIDFDFFINQDIDTKKLFQDCITIFNNHQIVKIFEATNTLYITVDGVKISFFSYHYEHIDKIITSEYLNIYSIKDIAAMKLRAIQNRATTKDYVGKYGDKYCELTKEKIEKITKKQIIYSIIPSLLNMIYRSIIINLYVVK